MTVSADIGILLLYIAQQLGVVLGFGSQAILLLTYLLGRRDGVINETEDAIARGVYRVLVGALIVTVISAAIMSFVFVYTGDAVLHEPAFSVKWVLILLSCLFAWGLKGSHRWNHAWEGISAANWGALFLVHIFAPVTTYFILGKIYGGWMIGFLVAWYLLLFALRGHNALTPVMEMFAKKDETQYVPQPEPQPVMRPVAPPTPTPMPTPAPAPIRQATPAPQTTYLGHSPTMSVGTPPPPMTPPTQPIQAQPRVVAASGSVMTPPITSAMPKSFEKTEVKPLAVPTVNDIAHVTFAPPVHLAEAPISVPKTAVSAPMPAPAIPVVEEKSSAIQTSDDNAKINSALEAPRSLADLPEFHVMPRSLDELRLLEQRRSVKPAQ